MLLRSVLATPASTFDGKLPPIRLDDWLFVTLASRVEVLRSPMVDWSVTFCGGYARGRNPSIITASGPELCAKGSIRVSSERNVHLVVLVGDTVRGASGWRPTSPSLRDVYIERVKGLSPTDSLDVPELGGLLDLLQTPFDEWPKLDLKTEVVWDPPKPLPGDIVRFSISVRNTGRRSANRAWVQILIAPCCDNKLEVRRDWFPYIPAGQSVRADIEVSLPEGRALASVSVDHGPGDKRVHLAAPDAQPTLVVVGYPSLPGRTVR